MTHDYRSEWEDLKEVLTAAHAVIEEIEGENGDTDTWWDLPTGIQTLGNRIQQLEAALREVIDACDSLDLDSPRPKTQDALESWLMEAEDFRQTVDEARQAITPEGDAEEEGK